MRVEMGTAASAQALLVRSVALEASARRQSAVPSGRLVRAQQRSLSTAAARVARRACRQGQGSKHTGVAHWKRRARGVSGDRAHRPRVACCERTDLSGASQQRGSLGWRVARGEAASAHALLVRSVELEASARQHSPPSLGRLLQAHRRELHPATVGVTEAAGRQGPGQRAHMRRSSEAARSCGDVSSARLLTNSVTMPAALSLTGCLRSGSSYSSALLDPVRSKQATQGRCDFSKCSCLARTASQATSKLPLPCPWRHAN